MYAKKHVLFIVLQDFRGEEEPMISIIQISLNELDRAFTVLLTFVWAIPLQTAYIIDYSIPFF